MAALPIFEIDNPNIRIEFHFARQAIFNCKRVGPFRVMHPAESPCRIIGFQFALRRWAIERPCAIKPIKPDKDGACFRCTPFAQNGKSTFNLGAAQKG